MRSRCSRTTDSGLRPDLDVARGQPIAAALGAMIAFDGVSRLGPVEGAGIHPADGGGVMRLCRCPDAECLSSCPERASPGSARRVSWRMMRVDHVKRLYKRFQDETAKRVAAHDKFKRRFESPREPHRGCALMLPARSMAAARG